MIQYNLSELFPSRQGEGANTGRPAVFIRLSGCNLACPWCDTDHRTRRQVGLETLLEEATSFGIGSIILTGGEPLVHPHWEALVRALRARNLWVALETNATVPLTPDQHALFNYIAASPKTKAFALRQANELRLVADGTLSAQSCRDIAARLQAQRHYISPCWRSGRFAWNEALELLAELNSDRPLWSLSVQVHKLAGFP